jgi:hypothetical protein
MAFAIMGGLLVGTLLMLIFLPTLYLTVFGDQPGEKGAATAATAPRPAG